MNESEVNWIGSLGEELIMQDLLHGSDELPMLPWKWTEQEHISPNKIDEHGSYRPVIALPEKGLGAKMENKYTLRIKTCGDGVADDGYKWRKYGQKSIKNSPNPRSYYRCTNPRCNAKRQVERSTEDPEMLIITYEGLHLHYTYSHFLPKTQDFSTAGLHAMKKSRIQSVALQSHVSEGQQMQPIVQRLEIRKQLQASQEQEPVSTEENKQDNLLEVDMIGSPAMKDEIMQEGLLYNAHCSQGLLEDIVPLMVRKPCSPETSSKILHLKEKSSNGPSYSQASSPSYSSSLIWPPSTFHFDGGILSSIV